MQIEKLYTVTLVTLLLFIILSGVFFLVFFLQYLKKRNKKKEIKLILEKEIIEKNKISNEKNLLENKLINTQKQVNLFKDTQRKKINDDRNKIISELQKTVILTDDDWNNFKKKFRLVYPNFITRLNIKFPKLTKSEKRFLILTKLNLSKNEIADLQGVSYNAIRMLCYRLLNKLDKKVTDLSQIIDEVDGHN